MSPTGEDLVIGIGAQKAGTTSVWAALREQAWFLPARRKELHYFSLHPERPEAWYWEQFPPRQAGRIRGEMTPDYLRVPQVPHRLARVAPAARLVVLLRNPVDRAYSAFLHGWRLGEIPRSMTFDEALAAEPQRRGRAFAELYEGGLYARQLRRFLEHFPREQLHIELFEDLIGDGGASLARILRFANPAADVPPTVPFPHRNPARQPLPWAVARVRTRAFRWARDRDHHRIARVLQRLERDWPQSGRRTAPPLEPATRRRLLERYAPENAALAQMLNRPLPGWDR